MTRDERAAISILNAYKEGYESAIEDYKKEPTDENLHREREQAYMQGYEDASKRFRQEPCDDAVSRADVIELIERGVGNKSVTIDGFTFGKSLMLYHVKQLPSVTQKCEKCAMNGSGSKYCDNCGAKMVEPHESEEQTE